MISFFYIHPYFFQDIFASKRKKDYYLEDYYLGVDYLKKAKIGSLKIEEQNSNLEKNCFEFITNYTVNSYFNSHRSSLAILEYFETNYWAALSFELEGKIADLLC